MLHKCDEQYMWYSSLSPNGTYRGVYIHLYIFDIQVIYKATHIWYRMLILHDTPALQYIYGYVQYCHQINLNIRLLWHNYLISKGKQNIKIVTTVTAFADRN